MKYYIWLVLEQSFYPGHKFIVFYSISMTFDYLSILADKECDWNCLNVKSLSDTGVLPNRKGLVVGFSKFSDVLVLACDKNTKKKNAFAFIGLISFL